MAEKYQLIDHLGRPLERQKLTEEIAAPTFGGVRSPITSYPGDGLDPMRLAHILRQADVGDPVQYLELAETIEERDLHYLGVLGTRRRAVSQIPVTVIAPKDATTKEIEIAAELEDWVDRDELEGEFFDMLDAVGKGYSFTEIIWDTSAKQYRPLRLEYRDPRHFRFACHDLKTPLRLDDDGQEVPLEAFKFIYNRMSAKSGLAIRSGIARAALWGWMFKAYTQRDWAIFTQTYGQPLRVGKYGPGAGDADRDKLFRAVSNIAGDCAAIIPESMTIDFIETGNLSASVDHYEKRSDWLDKQVSKAVLGQTSTTDAQVGGLGSGKEHREVQEVIERADCKALQTVINRDLTVPFVILNHGPQERYPKIVIGRPEEEDLERWSRAIGPMVDRGMRVPMSAAYEKFNIPEAGESDEILQPIRKSAPNTPRADDDGGKNRSQGAVKPPLNGQEPDLRPSAHAEGLSASAGNSAPQSILAERLLDEATDDIEVMLGQFEVMLEKASTLDELREMLVGSYPDLDSGALSSLLAQALMSAELGGRVAVQEEAGD